MRSCLRSTGWRNFSAKGRDRQMPCARRRRSRKAPRTRRARCWRKKAGPRTPASAASGLSTPARWRWRSCSTRSHRNGPLARRDSNWPGWRLPYDKWRYEMKKFVNDPRNYVAEMLRGIALANPTTLRYVPEHNLIMRADAPSDDKVSIVQGSGSGHEPAHVMFVGKGMLDAACPGDVFAAPPSDYVYETRS